MKLSFTVEKEFSGLTAENYLRNVKNVSKRLITRLKREKGGMLSNGELLRSIDKVFEGDEILLSLQDTASVTEGACKTKVPKVYEDDYLIVYNKPFSMPVHPSHRHRGDTLSDVFLSEYPTLTFHAVNRLDKDTSGLCIVAKDRYCTAALQKGNIRKIYTAIVCGIMQDKKGIIDFPIAREQESIIKRVVRDDGQRAVTEYEVIAENENYSFVKILLHTGRTHQIRVHFSHIGHPLLGDDLYGGDMTLISRQALCCTSLEFMHPVTNENIFVECQLPDDMKKLL